MQGHHERGPRRTAGAQCEHREPACPQAVRVHDVGAAQQATQLLDSNQVADRPWPVAHLPGAERRARGREPERGIGRSRPHDQHVMTRADQTGGQRRDVPTDPAAAGAEHEGDPQPAGVSHRRTGG